MADYRWQNSRYFEARIYRDEPIQMTAEQAEKRLPQKYRDMRKIARRYDAFRQSDEWLFYTQGKFMENVEDDYEYTGKFERYFPTYRIMNDSELRGYFSWRTKVRRGVIEPTSLSFAFIYIYELLNGIGVKSAEEGYQALRTFREAYREIDTQIERYMDTWLNDYVVYYGLDRELLADSPDAVFDRSLLILQNCETQTEEDLFGALTSLSAYRLNQSKFYQQYPDDFKHMVCRVFVRMEEYYKKNRKYSLCERLFGRMAAFSYYMFSSAIFYGRMKYSDYEYTVNEIHRYRCKDGKWSCEKISGNRAKNRELGMILKTIDCKMRERYQFKYRLKEEKATKILLGIIDKELEEYLLLKKKQEAPKIEIDLSKLQGIRQSSNLTRDKLIVEEEIQEDMPEMPVVSPEWKKPEEACFAKEAEQENQGNIDSAEETGLSDLQIRFLRCLLNQEPYDSLLRENGVMLSVIADAVNEALFERFGDTVIDCAGDVPELIEDYVEELRSLILI